MKHPAATAVTCTNEGLSEYLRQVTLHELAGARGMEAAIRDLHAVVIKSPVMRAETRKLNMKMRLAAEAMSEAERQLSLAWSEAGRVL